MNAPHTIRSIVNGIVSVSLVGSKLALGPGSAEFDVVGPRRRARPNQHPTAKHLCSFDAFHAYAVASLPQSVSQ